MNHAIIFTGHGRELSLSRLSGAKKIANVCESIGWKVDVIDYFTQWSDEQLDQLTSKLITADTKWIGISYTFLGREYERVRLFLHKLQELHPEIIHIIGGSNSFLEKLPADYFISGYAENAILKVLDYEFGNGPMPRFEKRHGGKYINATRDYPSAAAPSYSVVYDESDHLTPQDVLTIELSRGCKFRCAYCAYPFLGVKEDTSASEEHIYNELKTNYDRWGITKYIIADDTLNDRTSKLIKLRNVVKRLDFKPAFAAYVRADLFKAHPEQIEILAECNVAGQFYGIETFHKKAGQIVGKGMDPDTMKQILIDARNYFVQNMDYYRGYISLIIGLPHETHSDLRQTVQWLNKNWSDQTANFHTLVIQQDGEYVSAMGQNLSKYGYEKMEGVMSTSQVFDNNMIMWKSPWMDSKTSLDIRHELLNTIRSKLVAAFAVPAYLSMFGKKLSELENDSSFIGKEYGKRYYSHVNNYIDKKLST